MSVTPQHPLFNSIRVTVSRYNKKTGEHFQVTVMGNACKVWTAAEAATAPAEDRPTKFEFLAYLDTLMPDQHFVLPPALEDRFEELSDWVIEYEEANHKGFVAEFDAFKRELTVTRKAA